MLTLVSRSVRSLAGNPIWSPLFTLERQFGSPCLRASQPLEHSPSAKVGSWPSSSPHSDLDPIIDLSRSLEIHPCTPARAMYENVRLVVLKCVNISAVDGARAVEVSHGHTDISRRWVNFRV